jgi:hypothetical protein
MNDDGHRIEVDEYIEAPPSEAFDYVADPERRTFGNDQLELGDEIERDAPSRIAWQVTTADGASRRTGTVEIAIIPEGPGSRVRVTHEISGPSATMGTTSELALAS